MEDGPQTYDPFKHRCVGTEYTFAWLPQICHITGKRLWLEYAYRQTAMIMGPGDALFDFRWYHKHAFLVARLKGII